LRPSNEEISVVFQGPVLPGPGGSVSDAWTRIALESARAILPGAEIILSTWKGSDVSGLVADGIVESDDPGAECYHGTTIRNNVNRQIVSTRAGIAAATRPFVLKLRSETCIVHDGFRNYFGKYQANCGGKIVSERVVASSIWSYVPREVSAHSCYAPSDWFHFGRAPDVRDIWDVPLAPEPETTLWFTRQPFPAEATDRSVKLRYSIEQYVWVSYLRKHHPVAFDSLWELSDETVRASERALAANLVLISPRAAGLRSQKHAHASDSGAVGHIRMGCYTHRHWRALYELHCAGRRLHPALLYLPLFRCARSAIKLIHHVAGHAESQPAIER
jgi:WavE lipopolysaccharide synthesis protein